MPNFSMVRSWFFAVGFTASIAEEVRAGII
jgi:hypothetical protein